MQGRCGELPPESFNLTEPVPPGACAILVKEDFLDAPLGTTCLLLDSLYIAVDTTPMRRRPRSSVLVLHVRYLHLLLLSSQETADLLFRLRKR